MRWTGKHIGEVVADRFEIEELLGSGTQGRVYKAIDRETGTRVAIKVMQLRLGDDTARVRLEREADALEHIDSEGVARLVGRAWDAGGLLCLATEYLEGKTLHATLRELRGTRIPDSEVLRIVREIAPTLDRAHAKGLVHRDVKPTNVFLCADGRVKLLDFGYVRIFGAGTLTAQGVVPGTPSYLAPESVFGNGVDARGDVYSLGVMTYFLLAGQLPFVGKSNLDVIEKANRDPRPSLHAKRPDLPVEIDAFVERALAREPEARFQRTTELADALEYVLSLEPDED